MFSSTDSLEAWIEEKSSRKRLNEHCVEYKPAQGGSPPTTICFLETSTEPFVIRLKRSKSLFPGDDIKAVCEIDGKDIGFSIWRADRMEYDWTAVWERRDGELYKSSLKFDALATTTDPSKVDIAVEELQRIGTIVITLTQGTTKVSKRRPDIEVFHRVKGKAMENRGFLTSVTTAKSTKRKEWKPAFYDFTPKGSGMPYHRFVFNYRPRRVLEFIGKFEGDEAGIDFSQRYYPSPLASDASSMSSSSPSSLGDAVHGEISSKSERQLGSSSKTSEVSRGSSVSSMSVASGSGGNISPRGSKALSRRSSRLFPIRSTSEKKELCVYSLRPRRKRSYEDEDD